MGPYARATPGNCPACPWVMTALFTTNVTVYNLHSHSDTLYSLIKSYYVWFLAIMYVRCLLVVLDMNSDMTWYVSWSLDILINKTLQQTSNFNWVALCKCYNKRKQSKWWHNSLKYLKQEMYIHRKKQAVHTQEQIIIVMLSTHHVRPH